MLRNQLEVQVQVAEMLPLFLEKLASFGTQLLDGIQPMVRPPRLPETPPDHERSLPGVNRDTTAHPYMKVLELRFKMEVVTDTMGPPTAYFSLT